MRPLVLALTALLAACAASLPPVPAEKPTPAQREPLVLSGETQTTWRPGDVLQVGGGCFDVDIMIVVAESNAERIDADLWRKLLRGGQCFDFRRGRMLAILVRWVAGPFHAYDGTDGGVWEIESPLEKPAFIWLDDAIGDHPAIKRQSM